MNDIGITWTSDQKQLIADQQKRQLMFEKDNELLKKGVALLKEMLGVGQKTTTGLTAGYQDVNRELSRLSRLTQTAFQKPVSAMDSHLARLKELRVLYRMGKIDQDQFNAASGSSKKQYYEEIGLLQRLRAEKKQAQEESKQALKAEAAATRAFYAERHAFWEQEKADQADKEATARAFRGFKVRSIEEEKIANKNLADQVRKGLLTEKESARVNFRERMRQLHDLQRAGALSGKEYTAAAQQAFAAYSKVAGIDMSKMWAGVPSQLTGILTTTAAVAAAMKLARMEFENLRSMQKDSANTTSTYAEAQNEAVQNLDSSMTAEELDKQVMDLAKEKHVSPAFVMRAASNVLGARGAVSAKEAIGAIRTSIDFNRYDQGSANFTASAILQAKAARPDASYEALLGQQKSAKIASPVVKDEDFAHYLVPGASGAKAFADSEKDFYSLASHLGARMGDSAGRVTGTATVDLQRDLHTHPGLKGVKDGGEGMTMARLRAIAFDKKYAGVKAKLLGDTHAKSQDELVRSGGKLTTEARAYGAIALLLQGDKESWEQLTQKRKEVLEPGKEAEALVAKQRKDLQSLPAQRTTLAEKGVQAETEILQLQNQGAARGAVSREAIEKVLKAAGVSKTGQVLSGLKWELDAWGGQTAPASQAQQVLRKYAKQEAGFHDESSGSIFTPRNIRPANAEEMQTADSLRRAARALEALASDERMINVNAPPVGVDAQESVRTLQIKEKTALQKDGRPR